MLMDNYILLWYKDDEDLHMCNADGKEQVEEEIIKVLGTEEKLTKWSYKTLSLLIGIKYSTQATL